MPGAIFSRKVKKGTEIRRGLESTQRYFLMRSPSITSPKVFPVLSQLEEKKSPQYFHKDGINYCVAFHIL